MTNRALILASYLANLESATVRGALRSEDTHVMVNCLRQLGVSVTEKIDGQASILTIAASKTRTSFKNQKADLYCAESGTTMRFVTALVCAGHGVYRLDGSPRMRQRPIEDLVAALRQLGADAHCANGDGCPPVVVRANGLQGGRVRVRGEISSQFLSAVLMVAPLAKEPVIIEIEGPLVSTPYVSMTVAMMRRQGLKINTHPGPIFEVSPLGNSTADIEVEPDASAASYFFGAAAIAGGRITVAGLTRNSIQGDIRFVDLLERMGCSVKHTESGITVGGRVLRGIDADMNDISDTMPTLAAVACFAKGPTTIRNVAHVRNKESDRLHVMATELRRVGAGVQEFADGLTITPGPLRGGEIETYNDHRIAMSMALVGLKTAGIVIKNPNCVAKTYPSFFEDLEKLRGSDICQEE